MACYWGFQTKPNKIIWGICVFLWFTGVVLVLAGSIGGAAGTNCFDVFKVCQDFYDDRSFCADYADRVCKYKTWAALLAAGVVIFIIGFVPTCYFCCCANNPNKFSANQATSQGVAMGVVVGTHQPMMGQPVPGHPYGDQPQQQVATVQYPPAFPQGPSGSVVQAVAYQPPAAYQGPGPYQAPVPPAASHGPPGVVQAQPYYPPPPK